MELDWTILAAGLVFLLTLLALNLLLFKPLFRVLDERRERSEGARKAAEDRMDYRKSLLESCDRKIREEKQHGYQLADQVRKEAVQLRESRLEAARQEAANVLVEARGRIRAEVESARADLQQHALEISGTIVSRILEKT